MATRASRRGTSGRQARARATKARQQRGGRQRGRARRSDQRRREREQAAREVQINVGQAGENVRRIRANARQAVGNVGEAGAAAAELAREVTRETVARGAEVARETVERGAEAVERGAEAVGRRAGAAREAVQRAPEVARETIERAPRLVEEAQEAATALLDTMIPDVVRRSARRSRRAVEEVGARAAVSLIQTGTRVLTAAADYLAEVSPRRRVDHGALHEVIRDQVAWTIGAVEAYDQTAVGLPDDERRTRVVRAKLHAVRQVEMLTQLAGRLGGKVPSAEQTLAVPAPTTADGGPGAARQGLAHALTFAVQRAEGWRALARLAPFAQSDAVADAVTAAVQSVGEEPEDEVEFFREALLDETVAYVLR